MASAEAQAKAELKKKLALEKGFKPKINKQFRVERTAFQKGLAETGNVTEQPEMIPAWRQLEGAQFVKTSDEFRIDVELSETEQITTDRNIAEFNETQSVEQATSIVDTSQKDMVKAASEARSQLTEEEEGSFTNATLAVVAGAILGSLQRNRVDTIAVTTTQVAAEGSKGLSVESQSHRIKKRWVAILDSRTRPSHIAANGQVRRANEDFMVNGQRLRWPGDSTKGASLAEIIMCRCTSLYNPE